ncbi:MULTISPECIES: helix-turn-helix domain-containing protein [unclassified Nocardia]|uniref:PucR family transcriptional regulator n=1 Tax=unclassified Nocardia TaxID=2637762 RepID=UPI0027E10592|nr:MULTISPECIES: helix-turn-helix domain-containing protein [unclassified Nocardia]
MKVATEEDLLGTDTDLFGLAQMVAQSAGGMVSIEDPQSHVLAYSASDQAADQMRVLSILGREGPREYLQVLRKWGVFDRMRRSDEVIDVPAHEELRIKRRLAVGIHRPADESGVAPRLLGSIWLQQGDRPFKPDAAEILRGAAAIAARIISRSLAAPSAEAMLVQRLFGARQGGIDIASAASTLNIPMSGPAAVIGFALTGVGDHSSFGNLLRLRASSFRPDAVTTLLGDRAYVLFPQYQSSRAVTQWARQLVEQLEAKRSVNLCAAIACPVADLTKVAAARGEVDRVLDSNPDRKVTTLAESRTSVLLGEILDLVAGRPDLHDPRLQALFEYDRKHSANLRESVEIYLRAHGDVRNAANALCVHPNTLRYRVRRVENILGIDLGDPGDRLLLELQLALHRRMFG